jgi:hypothetical protein
MEDKIYDFVIENYGLSGWDGYIEMDDWEKEDWLKEIGFYDN